MVRAEELLGDFEQLQILFFRDKLEGFTDVVDVVSDGHAPVLSHGAAFGKGLGHDGQEFDALVKDVVHLEQLIGFRARSEIVVVPVPVHTIPGHYLGISGNGLEPVFSHGIILCKRFGHNDEESEPGKKNMMVLDLFHVLTGCAESLHSQFRGVNAVEVEDEITIK
jgi:hypothetical protein